MEVLYAIISILFIIAVIILMILLFRKKPQPDPTPKPNPVTPSSGFGTKVQELFRGSGSSHHSAKGKSEYQLIYGSPESMNETMRDTALDVFITNVRDSQVKVKSSIQDDDKLNYEGVVIGREGCDYNMRSLLMDRDGTFLIKRKGDSYVLVANRNSINGIRTEFRGEKKKRIEFENGHAVCYVGPICFSFSVPGCEAVSEPASSRRASFYSDETINEGTRAFTIS